MTKPMRLLRHQRKALYFLPELEERALRQTRGALQKAQERLEQRQREVASANADPAMHRLFIQEIVPKINQIKTGQRFGYREALGRLAQQPENSLLRDAIVDATVRALKENPYIIKKIPASENADLKTLGTRLVKGWLATHIAGKRDSRNVQSEKEHAEAARKQLEKHLKKLEADRPKVSKALADIDAYLKERQANLATRKEIMAFLRNLTEGKFAKWAFSQKFTREEEKFKEYSAEKIRTILGAVSKKWLDKFEEGYSEYKARGLGESSGVREGVVRAFGVIYNDLNSGEWRKSVDFPKPSKETLSGARQGFKTLRELGLRSPRKKQA